MVAHISFTLLVIVAADDDVASSAVEASSEAAWVASTKGEVDAEEDVSTVLVVVKNGKEIGADCRVGLVSGTSGSISCALALVVDASKLEALVDDEVESASENTGRRAMLWKVHKLWESTPVLRPPTAPYNDAAAISVSVQMREDDSTPEFAEMLSANSDVDTVVAVEVEVDVVVDVVEDDDEDATTTVSETEAIASCVRVERFVLTSEYIVFRASLRKR